MLCEEVVGVSVGYATGADVVAWCDWDLEVCVSSDVLGKRRFADRDKLSETRYRAAGVLRGHVAPASVRTNVFEFDLGIAESGVKESDQIEPVER